MDDSPPKPYLEYSQPSPNTLELSWPANAAGYVLQFATNLPSLTWLDVTNRVTTNVDVCSVTLSNTGPRQFFRLKK